MLRVQVFETALCQLLTELGMRGAADPERMPRTEDVMPKTGLGQLGGADCATELVLTFQHRDVPAAAGKQSRAGKRVDAAADDDRIVVSHERARGTRRR
jgi:hypothetical protein